MEAQRISNITPLAVAHKALRETRLQGFNIPKVYSICRVISLCKLPIIALSIMVLSLTG